MSTVVAERPAREAGRGDGGGPARRAVVRWGWRLFRREWRRHVLVLVMLAVAVAATIVGLGTAINASRLKADPTFGTAGSTTRRTITGATSGALALLGALLGTAGAYAALLVWYRSDLSPLGRVPIGNLVIILGGLPVLATAGGWLLAGREPPSMARQPLE